MNCNQVAPYHKIMQHKQNYLLGYYILNRTRQSLVPRYLPCTLLKRGLVSHCSTSCLTSCLRDSCGCSEGLSAPWHSNLSCESNRQVDRNLGKKGMLLCYQRGRGIFRTRDAWTSGWLGWSRMCILKNPCIWPSLCLSYLPVQADHAEQDQAGAGGLRGGECQTALWISNTFCYRSRKRTAL